MGPANWRNARSHVAEGRPRRSEGEPRAAARFDGHSEDGERRDLRGEGGDRGAADAVAEAADEEEIKPRLRTPPKATESSGVVASWRLPRRLQLQATRRLAPRAVEC